MKRIFTPTIQISIGLVSLTVSIMLIAFSFGLLPNEDRATLTARAIISENLAIQLADLAGRNDAAAIKETIKSIIERNGDILSVGIRGIDGKFLVKSDQHEALWRDPEDGKSSATHVHVPLMNANDPEGEIEIVFRPLATSANFFGLSDKIIGFIGFVSVAGWAGYYFILRRALRELDPSRAIPQRIKTAFDSLSEGVLILDEREFILLANNSFEKKIYRGQKSLLGTKISDLPWVHSNAASLAPEFPWRTAMAKDLSLTGIAMGVRSQKGEMQRLLVNATSIIDGKGIVRGAIATFDDVTAVHNTNEQLKALVDQLKFSQAKISEQNHTLQILAASDPLTGCFNRRTFFEMAEQELQSARSLRQPISFVMVDADHFKSVNDRFGHAVGDKVLIGIVDIVKQICGDRLPVGRYGGEEFCIVASGYSREKAEKTADRIRRAVADVTNWLPNSERVTISIGIATQIDGQGEITELTNRADEALYVAKANGRNRCVSWDSFLAQNRMPKVS